jgi:exodeoxyribonuclease VIII
MVMKRDYLSASALKAFAKSPNHYLDYVQRKFEPSRAMELGTLIHCLILEPEEFDSRYAVAPKVDRRTKAGKEEWLAFQDANGHLQVIDQAFYDEAAACVEAAEKDPNLQRILNEPFHAEQQLDGDLFDFPFTARLDLETEGFVYDLKTCQDASPDGFQRAAYNLDYHLQATIYRMLTGKPFRWIAVETSSPYNVMVYNQSEEAFQRTKARLGNLVEAFVVWDGKPKGYSTEVQTLDLPRWA